MKEANVCERVCKMDRDHFMFVVFLFGDWEGGMSYRRPGDVQRPRTKTGSSNLILMKF